MRKTVAVTIEGFTYDLSQVGAEEGKSLAIRFARVLGPFVPVLVKTAKAKDGDKAGSEAKLAQETVLELFGDLATALMGVDPAELEPLWDAFARHAFVRGKDGKTRQPLHDVFDEHFAGEYWAMWQFFVESAKLNFASFFTKLLAQASEQPDQGATP